MVKMAQMPAKQETQVDPGPERSPREGSGSLLQYSCLENRMNGEAFRTTVHRVAKSQP